MKQLLLELGHGFFKEVTSSSPHISEALSLIFLAGRSSSVVTGLIATRQGEVEG